MNLLAYGGAFNRVIDYLRVQSPDDNRKWVLQVSFDLHSQLKFLELHFDDSKVVQSSALYSYTCFDPEIWVELFCLTEKKSDFVIDITVWGFNRSVLLFFGAVTFSRPNSVPYRRSRSRSRKRRRSSSSSSRDTLRSVGFGSQQVENI